VAAITLLALCLCNPAEVRAQWTTSGTNISNTNTGNVGVGTTNPAAKLDVAETATTANRGIISTQYSNDSLGSRFFLRKARNSSGTSSAAVQAFDTLGLIMFGGYDGSGFVDGGRVSSVATQTWTAAARGSNLSFSVTANNSTALTTAMLIDHNGNVGVGTLTPGYKLDVAGQVRSSSGGFVFPDGTTQATAANGTVTGVAAGNGLTGGGAAGSLTLNVGAGSGLTVAPDSISVNYGSTAGTAVEGSTALTVTAGGGMSGGGTVTLGAGGAVTLTNNDKGSAQNIFKNVANAAGVTQFSAGSNNDAISFEGTGGTTVSFNPAAKRVTINTTASAASGWTEAAGGGSLNTTNLSAKVGVGTASPVRGLHVSGGDGTVGAEFILENTGMALDNRKFNLWGSAVAGGKGRFYFRLLNDAGTATTKEFLAFDNETGNVGVGTQAPTARLEVNGGSKEAVAIKATGGIEATGTVTADNVVAKFQDVAEWVPSVQKLTPGTVVVLDTGRVNHVVASASAYDTKVAGVVSEQPGVILGVAGEGKVKVATTGRVKVKADATRGAIKVGDLLVTSGVEGVAMKSVPVDLGGTPIHRPGTIIGKALEPLEGGTGEILVLLSLQ
jgi:hypothetical protein